MEIQDFPYIVRIVSYSEIDLGPNDDYCSGIIVSLLYALTVASCVASFENGVSVLKEPSKYYLKAGTVFLSGGVDYAINKFHVHPDCSDTYKNVYKSDMGAVQTERTMDMNNIISVAVLPSTLDSLLDQITKDGSLCEILVWSEINNVTRLTVHQGKVNSGRFCLSSKCAINKIKCDIYKKYMDESKICFWNNCTYSLGLPIVCYGKIFGLAHNSDCQENPSQPILFEKIDTLDTLFRPEKNSGSKLSFGFL